LRFSRRTARRVSRACFLAAFGVSAGVALAGIGAAAETFTLRMNVSTGATSALGVSALHFAEAVGRRSHGQLKVEVYPSLQLGTERESIDGLTTGVIDLAIQNSTWIVPLLPRFQVFDMPFLFRTSAHAFRVLDGPIGSEFAAELETKGIVALAWASGGFKELETTTKPIVVPEDMKGLRFRIQSGAPFVAMYQALGAIPVTIDLSEAFTGLAQHTVDGLDATLDNLSSSKLYTVVKHVAMTNHIFSVIPLTE
jgi:TRAP-type transport system periplasmic protein